MAFSLRFAPKNLARAPVFRCPSATPAAVSARCSMAAPPLRMGVAQMTSTNDLEVNYNTCSRLVKEAAAAGVNLLCLPESFSFVAAKDGESLKIAQPLDGPIMQRYCSLARESNIWLSLGGFQEKGPDDSHLYNTHVLLDSSGNIRKTYRKIHLFDVDVPGSMVYKESDSTAAGESIIVAESPVGLLGLTVCYDLRFPELYQQLRFQHHAQILLVPSAFTKVTGEAHWEILLRARAIETQCYVVAAAQAGRHSEKRESYGDSLIIDPWGIVIARLPDRLATGVAVADIDLSRIDSVRRRMPIAEHQRIGSCLKTQSGLHERTVLMEKLEGDSARRKITPNSEEASDNSASGCMPRVMFHSSSPPSDGISRRNAHSHFPRAKRSFTVAVQLRTLK